MGDSFEHFPQPEQPLLVGRTVLVTGGARGIGLGIARACLNESANVVVADIDGDALKRAKTSLLETPEPTESPSRRGMSERILTTTVDVTRADSVAEAFSQAKDRFGSVDGLVNNAGVIRLGPAVESSEDDWADQFLVNVQAMFVCCREFARSASAPAALPEAIGARSIVNIASNAGKVGYPNMAAYNASKAAVINMTRTLSSEWAEIRINVNAVCPGGVNTPMLKAVAESIGERVGEDPESLLQTMVPAQLGRHIRPEEVGAVVAFLLSDAAQIIRGQSINVDGGDTPY